MSLRLNKRMHCTFVDEIPQCAGYRSAVRLAHRFSGFARLLGGKGKCIACHMRRARP